MNPMNGVWITSLSDQAECLNRGNIIVFDKVTIVIFLLDNSYSSWSHIQTGNFVLLAYFPHYTGIRYDRLPFKEESGATSDQRSIYNETMAYNPSNITSSEMCAIWANVEDVLHAEIQTNSRTSLISNDAFRLARSTRGVQNVEFMSTHETHTGVLWPFLLCHYCRIIMVYLCIYSSVSMCSISFWSLKHQSGKFFSIWKLGT